MSIEDAAARLRHAADTGVPCTPVRDLLGEDAIDAAYAVQELNLSRRIATGDRVIGRKIGLTSPAVQAQLGVNQPDYGTLLASMEIADGGALPTTALSQPKVEAEIAFVMDRALPHPDVTAHEAIAAIGFVVPALEIVGSRIAGWDITIVDTIADNASSSHVVLGSTPKRLTDVDVVTATMRMDLDGQTVSTGCGKDCLGSPVSALVWLARTMAQRGTPLSAGDLILSGALGPMQSIEAGGKIEAEISGLGSVLVNIETT
ncbi:2-keto-4-pentenoate hydratase [Thalassococcus sp. S3]|uniref:2-keto-4-pentenoate hydratase n=1 Tax=Thalassococcus sp. S3 TaxID=2017482 RepID=UPI0010241CD4|nr:fumarylacetoacetate hydrolase family protein [Thalassococcus sp. S3]QBF33365.1 2-keto-4-pentenoate hydratase [Thalassococcus sp. S3]